MNENSLKIHFLVTEEHFKNGYRGAASRCPVNLAIRDALDALDVKRTYLSVTYRYAMLIRGSGGHWYASMPKSVEHWIEEYDKGGMEYRPIEAVITFHAGRLPSS